MEILRTKVKNDVLISMVKILEHNRDSLIRQNQKDLYNFNRDDQALYDRLVIDEAKVDSMINSIKEVLEQDDPIGKTISERVLDSGLQIENKTTPFGTIMIIYESRPDVTIEAAVLAFKSNNKILLKGGKEAYNSNKELVKYWHQALHENDLRKDCITMLELDRTQTQNYLKEQASNIDLIVPRGGERLIDFVKTYAKCPVLVSGRGNNFMYVAKSADWDKTKRVIVNAKTDKISACNALDKVLFNSQITGLEKKLEELAKIMKDHRVEVLGDQAVNAIKPSVSAIESDAVWKEEFLSRKILFGLVDNLQESMEKINHYSGHHSSIIMTEQQEEADTFMEYVDSAVVYQNASSRFTDGGAMGVGAELAISTDKLHHRGPLGLKQLVSNKYFVKGDGHIRS